MDASTYMMGMMGKRIWLLLALVLALAGAGLCQAAEVSSDRMILEWFPKKVWINKGELCMQGEFVNKRSDLTITRLNDFEVVITFDRGDGTRYQFQGKPKKLPNVKITPNGRRSYTFNFGPFEGDWKSWVVSERSVFTYISGSRW